MTCKDYYAVLGVTSTACADDLRLAYRKLARRYHPDVSQAVDAQARIREINEAYEVLGKPDQRARYDALRARAQASNAYAPFMSYPASYPPPPVWNQVLNAALSTTLSAALRVLKGKPRHAQRDFSTRFATWLKDKRPPRPIRTSRIGRGADYHVHIDVPLEDTLQGAMRAFSVRVIRSDASKPSHFPERKINVAIPAGIRAGQRICMRGQGGMGRQGAGDLYVEVRFKPHPVYRIAGGDLFATLPVAPWELVLGAVVQAPTLAGPVPVSIPAGSQHGSELCLKGCGLAGQPQGDLYLTLAVTLPPADTEASRQAYRDWAEQMCFDPRAAQPATTR